MSDERDPNDVYPELDETTDGPDLGKAHTAVQEAQADTVRTENILQNANRSFDILRHMHQENHFVEKLRIAIRGAS